MADEHMEPAALLGALHPLVVGDLGDLDETVMLKTAIAVVTYLDSDGDEKLCLLHSGAPLTVRMGLVEYAREWHRTEVRWLLEEDEDD